MSIRDATLYYLNKATKYVGGVMSGGKDVTIFGSGTEDITFTQNAIFENSSSLYNTQSSLEYRNVTINAGVTVQGNNYLNASRPFFLKVSGTLTVNGNLNMNGQGGYYANPRANWGYAASDCTSIVGANNISGNLSLGFNKYLELYNYGASNTFFDGKTKLVGAGSSLHYKWKRWGKNRHRRPFGESPLNGGGGINESLPSDTISLGGGGFLALYYENLDNQLEGGPIWDEMTGNSYYPNINANGGRGYYAQNSGKRCYGGGMMVIAARNIVIGPQGSISCNPADTSELSINSRTGWVEKTRNPDASIFDTQNRYITVVHDIPYACKLQTARNAGGIAWMNRPPTYYLDYDYGKLSKHLGTSGGGGVCFGYKISPRYTKVNH